MTHPHEPGTYATQYAAADFPVLPLHSIRDGRCTCRRDCGRDVGKHPLTEHGKDDATTDSNQVAQWLSRWPWANWGIRPTAGGLIVLDVDPRNGGHIALLELTRRHGELPQTLTARTGGGGLHIWLSHTGVTLGRLCQGVDVKTMTGYVVAPPSLHASGNRYRWLHGAPAASPPVSPTSAFASAIAPAPGWIAELLRPPAPPQHGQLPSAPTSSRAALVGLLRTVLDAPEGNRNNALYWAARRMLEKVADGQLAETAATGMLLDAATAAGLSDPEAQRTVGSARRAALGA